MAVQNFLMDEAPWWLSLCSETSVRSGRPRIQTGILTASTSSELTYVDTRMCRSRQSVRFAQTRERNDTLSSRGRERYGILRRGRHDS